MNSVKIKKLGDKILITFKSKSFLQNQVRSMVGCLKYLAVNKWDLKNLNLYLNQKIEGFVPLPLQQMDYI